MNQVVIMLTFGSEGPGLGYPRSMLTWSLQKSLIKPKKLFTQLVVLNKEFSYFICHNHFFSLFSYYEQNILPKF